jgi:enoyl-CoA hydratase/carnithine racemase
LLKEYSTISLKEIDSVSILELNRPEKLNAFNMQMLDDMLDAIDHINTNDNIKSLVITGSGRAFCAGADLSSGEKTFDNSFDTKAQYKSDFMRDAGGILNLKIYNSLKPVIAACNGDAVGIGATMQLPADVRIASKKSRFGFVFAKRGIVPDGCASWFLPKIVGIPMALELCYSGKIIDATEANRIGLVNYVVEDDNLIDKAVEISDLFCNSTAPVSVAMTRHMLWSLSAEDNPENAHIIESKLINSRGASDDAKEGVMSFLEKRSANFKNTISSDLPNDFPWRESQFKEKE